MSNSIEHELAWFKTGRCNCGPRTAALVIALYKELTAIRAQLAEAQRERQEFQHECAAAVREAARWQKVAAEASAEREHNANQAQAWRDVAKRLRWTLHKKCSGHYEYPDEQGLMADFDRMNNNKETT